MTTPRPHAELAAQLERLESAIQAVCQYNGGYNSSDVQEAFYDVVNELQNLGIDTKPPPPPKRYIGLTVNGRAWVLPEPLRVKPAHDEVVWILSIESWPTRWIWYDCEAQNAALAAGQLYATEADVQAWAEFDKWCRGGEA